MNEHWWSPRSPVPIYLGVALVVAGFVMITYTWAKVSLIVVVPAQLPYLVSGGLVGLGLILSGLTLVNVQVKRTESAKRLAQLERLADLITGGVLPPVPAQPPDDLAEGDDGFEPPVRASRSVWE